MAIADLCTLAQLKTYLNITDANDDANLALAITAASDATRQYCNRSFEIAGAATTRSFTAHNNYNYSTLTWVLDPFQNIWSNRLPKVFIDDIFDLTGLTVTNRTDSSSITFDRGWPWNAAARNEPFVALDFPIGTLLPAQEGALNINARWGWASVPTGVATATMLQASRYYKRKDAPFGVVGNLEMGGGMRLLAKVDADVAVMLSAWSRIWGAVA